jgi:hypothetical protein
LRLGDFDMPISVQLLDAFVHAFVMSRQKARRYQLDPAFGKKILAYKSEYVRGAQAGFRQLQRQCLDWPPLDGHAKHKRPQNNNHLKHKTLHNRASYSGATTKF